MNCIVTGGCGFIGYHLTKRLVEEGHNVAVIDNMSTGKRENLIDGTSFYEYDLAETDHDNAFKFATTKFGCIDTIFHLAAIPKVQFSVADPVKSNKHNITATLHVLEAARKFGVSRVVFSSSCSVYGDQEGGKFVETMEPNPLSPYALQKYTGEIYCKQYYNIFDIKTISLRYFNVYGPRMDADAGYAALIPGCNKAMAQGLPFIINGDGEQTRDFTYVDDVVSANILASQAQQGFGEAYNIGAGNPTSVNQIIKMISGLTGNKDYQPEYGPPVVETRHAHADISKACGTFGWFPTVSIEEGLSKALV